MSRPRGFTLIELVVVISIVALLFGVALDRLQRYQELAERVALEQNLAAMNVALTMKFASLVISGRGTLIEKEIGANPIQLLARAPENYLGELYAPDVSTLAGRSWFYDRQSGDLVYVPGLTRYLTFPAGQDRRLRFRVALTEANPDPDAPKELRQPLMSPVAPFRWVVE